MRKCTGFVHAEAASKCGRAHDDLLYGMFLSVSKESYELSSFTSLLRIIMGERGSLMMLCCSVPSVATAGGRVEGVV